MPDLKFLDTVQSTEYIFGFLYAGSCYSNYQFTSKAIRVKIVNKKGGQCEL
jgi:hypothetical protein